MIDPAANAYLWSLRRDRWSSNDSTPSTANPTVATTPTHEMPGLPSSSGMTGVSAAQITASD